MEKNSRPTVCRIVRCAIAVQLAGVLKAEFMDGKGIISSVANDSNDVAR
jgi:hypothetical protein